jgi:hypothetical protein
MKIQRISEKSVKFHFYKLHYNDYIITTSEQWLQVLQAAKLCACAQKALLLILVSGQLGNAAHRRFLCVLSISFFSI